jgi:hypothetical protein
MTVKLLTFFIFLFKNIQGGMMDSKMDPYVRLRYKHVKSWSSTKYSSNQHKHPMWTDKENNLFTFVFDADKNSSINKPMLVIDCWDDNFGLDSLIGGGTIDLTRLLSSQPGSEKWREYKIELLHKGRGKYSLKYIVYDQC